MAPLAATLCRACLAALLPLLLPLGAAADGLEADSALKLRGFGTVGVVGNSTSGAHFIRDILQPGGVAGGWSSAVDSRLGLQANFRLTDQIEGVAQVVSMYNYDGSYRPGLEWAFVSYSPDPAFKVRLGRLGWDVYMLSDSRNVGYSYLWVRPPVEYFGQLQIPHVDGADVVVKHQLGGGIASAKLYAGLADQKVPSPPTADYDLAGSVVRGVNLDYQKGAWQFRVGYTAVKVENELPGLVPLLGALSVSGPGAAALGADLSLAGKTIEIVSAGTVFENGPWQAQLMVNRFTSDTLIFPQKDSGYLLLGYRIDKWTPFVNFAATRSVGASQRRTGLPLPNPLDTAVATTLAVAQSRQNTLSLGVRYDFMRNADLKVQLDRVRVSDHAALLWRNARADWNGHATILSVALDFVF
jgi:hypothetical protein